MEQLRVRATRGGPGRSVNGDLRRLDEEIVLDKGKGSNTTSPSSRPAGDENRTCDGRPLGVESRRAAGASPPLIESNSSAEGPGAVVFFRAVRRLSSVLDPGGWSREYFAFNSPQGPAGPRCHGRGFQVDRSSWSSGTGPCRWTRANAA